MKSAEEIYDEIIRAHQELESIPENLHLFCPKVQGEENEDSETSGQPGNAVAVQETQARAAAAEDRLQKASWTSLILGIKEDQASRWRPEWIARTENFLTDCDDCVRNWHMGRKALRNRLLKEFDEETANLMEAELHRFDKARIDRGLASAVRLLEEHGPMSPLKLVKLDKPSVLAFYEALCSVPYLSDPENRQNFNIVFQRTQEKKPLKLQGTILPTMTVFLFQQDVYRQKYARTAWENIPAEFLTVEQFDWAVNEHLARAIANVNRHNTPFWEVELFWDGFLVLLGALGEDVILHGLRGMQIQPDVYNLATAHLACNSEKILALIVKSISALLAKSPKAFWDALSNMNPPQLPMAISMCPAFEAFLDQSFETMVPDGTRETPILVAFVRVLMGSLATNRRTDVCDSILAIFLGEPNAPKQHASDVGQVTILMACLTALDLTLRGFLDTNNPKYRLTVTALHFVNPIINCVVKYRETIGRAAIQSTDDPRHAGLPSLALAVIESALTLDARAIREEWKTLEQKMKIPDVVPRRSADLWRVWKDRIHERPALGSAFLTATLPLRGVQEFLPDKTTGVIADGQQKAFNEAFDRTAKAVADALEKVCDLKLDELQSLLSRTPEPIVAATLHGNESIRMAGVQLITVASGELTRAEAITQLVRARPDVLLTAFAHTVDKLTNDRSAADPHSKLSANPWPPVPYIASCSWDVLDALCDGNQGLLRRGSLDHGVRRAVRLWWTQMWQFVDYSWSTVRSWSYHIQKSILETFCRQIMELAMALLAEDGVIASALAGVDGRNEAKIMREILDVPKRYTRGFIEMIQLKDHYLVKISVEGLVKLLARLDEYSMSLPSNVAENIRNACLLDPREPTKYLLNTNMKDTQRAELLAALGGGEEPEVVVVPPPRAATTKPRVQSTIDAWSRGSSSTPSRSSTPGTTPRTTTTELSDPAPASARNQAFLKSLMPKQPPVKPTPSSKMLVANRPAKVLVDIASRKREKEESDRKRKEIAEAHKARAKSDLMVPSNYELSSEEEADDDDDGDAELTARAREKDAAFKEAERRQRMAARRATGPVKKARLQRSAKDKLARVTPHMGRLHQAILEWDIFHEGNDPPNGYACENVANAYPSSAKYKDTFFPLLISEAWRSFVTAKDESTAKKFGVKILTRMTVDNFLEVSTAMPVVAARDRGLAEGDIVLLSKAEEPLDNKDKDAPHCLARIWKTTYKKANLEVAYRISSRALQILPVLTAGAEFQAIKITNMTTIEREFAALESLQHYDLVDEVLRAVPSPMLQFGDQLIGSMQRMYSLNRGQVVAILNAKENDGFTLVQGPPGTGKTKTIVAMVGVLLTGAILASTAGTAVGRPGAAGPQSQGTARKLLVCAPSNAAVDELVLRLKSGVRETNGTLRKINVLRLGRSDAINAAVKDVTLDELVNAELNKQSGNGEKAMSDRDKLHKRAGEIKGQLAELSPALEAARMDDKNPETLGRIQREYDQLRSEQRRIGAQIDRDKESGNTYAREAEIKRRQLQQKILNEAHVLCATLSGSGHEMFKSLDVEFDTVIIDEAAQCVELSALIPLKYGCTKCVLVGDPKQLPPTVLSQSAAKYGYDQSLFVRMQQNHPETVHLLDTQYRMHPEISCFPSKVFYEERLVDGDDMATLRRQPWHGNPLLGPYRFFDVEGAQERGVRGRSLVNVKELQVAMQLYQSFRSQYPDIDVTGKIGIITPYKAQLNMLRQRFAEEYGDAITKEIEFNTTDAFQGRECEIIIFSCVRASPTGGIGFMTDIRRMNVGLTRAKSSLWILGDARALRQGQYWHQLIQDAQHRGRYTTGNILGLLKTAPPRTADAARPASKVPGGFMAHPVRAAADIRMEDAPPPVPPPPPVRKSRPVPPPQPPLVPQTARDYRPSAETQTSGRQRDVNERGEAMHSVSYGAERPVIHSSPGPVAQKSLKRPLEGNPSLQPAKRPAAVQGQPLPRPPRRPTDPSAMEVLGMVPPQRPPLADQGTLPPNPLPKRPAPRPMVPKKKAPVDPFIRKRNNK